MKNITAIKSTHFTTDIPKRCKFKLGEVVRLRKLDRVSHPALTRYGANAIGTVVGINYNKGNYMRCYPYYIQFGDDYVFPIKPCYLEERNTEIAKAKQLKRTKRIQLRKTVEGCVREVLKKCGVLSMVGNYQITDKAIAQIRKIYE